MAKSTQATKPAPAPVTSRGVAYAPTDTITWRTGDGARRVVETLSVARVKAAIGSGCTIAQYVAKFGPLCEADPLPGRGGQKGATQAIGILRWLDREQAVIVGAKPVKPAKK